jgi:anaerobic selenocysteine-containing dehydrogenase
MTKAEAKDLKVGDRVEMHNAFGTLVRGVVTGLSAHVTIDMSHTALVSYDSEVTVLEHGALAEPPLRSETIAPTPVVEAPALPLAEAQSED